MHHAALMMLFYRLIRINLLGNCAAGNLPAVTHQSSVSRLAMWTHRAEEKSDRDGETRTHLHFIQLWLNIWREVRCPTGEGVKWFSAEQVFTYSNHHTVRRETTSGMTIRAFFPPFSINMTWPVFLTVFCNYTDSSFFKILNDCTQICQQLVEKQLRR